MSFEQGDRVRVVNQEADEHGEVGEIILVDAYDPQLTYLVEFKQGKFGDWDEWFNVDELEKVEA